METSSHVSQTGLELAKWLKMTSNPWSSKLHVLSAVVTDGPMPDFVYFSLKILK